MVINERKEVEKVERKNEQLRNQLSDNELLLTYQQEQLVELKSVIQDLSSKHDDFETTASQSTAPSTPAMANQEHMNKVLDALHLTPTTSGGDDIPPAPPTSFTHLLHPVLRTDVQAYDDFHALLEMSRKSSPNSRVNSASYNGLNIATLAAVNGREHPHLSGHTPSNGSSSSLATSGTLHSNSTAATTPASANSSFSTRDLPFHTTQLKETKFYKRALQEDIEPTLRLDTAPGLSWLARRTVISSMCEGHLVVEPMPASYRHFNLSCALCGDDKKDGGHDRTHRFRTSENENAQRYP